MTISLNLKQAVEVTGLSRSSLYNAMRDGALPALKSGRRTLILADDLDKFIKSLPKMARAA